jgi:hypothetical protein
MTTAKVTKGKNLFQPVTLEIVITTQEDLDILYGIGNLSFNQWGQVLLPHLNTHNVNALVETVLFRPLKPLRS